MGTTFDGALRVEVLGPVRAWLADLEIDLGPPRQRAVLGTLATRANQVVSRDELIDAVWGQDPPVSAVNSLHIYVAGLRREVEPGRRKGDRGRTLASARSGYVLRLRPGGLDAAEFEKHLGGARLQRSAGDPASAIRSLDAALNRWRGQPFTGIPGPFAERQRIRLRELQLTARQERAEALLTVGRHAELVAELSDLVREEPLHEGLRALLMRGLYGLGRQAEALAVFAEARRHLVEQLGVEPGPELRRVQQQVLTGTLPLDGTAPPARIPKPGRGGVPPSPTRLPPAPAQLPPDIADFTGRQKETELIRRNLLGDRDDRPEATAVVVIAGPAGVGKTALAIHAAQLSRDVFTGGQLYANLRGTEARPVTPRKVLARFLRALGVDDAAIPEDVEERTDLYRSIVANRALLVTLDDAADETQVHPLLPGSASCAVLVTSRARLAALPGAYALGLDVLDAGEARALLGHIAGAARVASDPQSADELACLGGYLPLAVRIIGAKLRARPHRRLSCLAGRLADERRRLDELAYGHLRVRHSLARSYHGLDLEGRRLFRRLGLLDAPDVAEWTGAALLNTTPAEAAEVFERLVDVHLLDVAGSAATGRERYRLRELDHIFARERAEAEEAPAERAEALRRAFGCLLALVERAGADLRTGDPPPAHGDAPRWRLSPAFTDRLVAAPRAWYETERPGIVAGVRQAGQAGLDELCWELAVTAGVLFRAYGHHDDWHETHARALAATRRAGNARGEAAVVRGLAMLRLIQDQRDRVAALAETTGSAETG